MTTEYLTAREVAEALKCSEWTVKSMLRRKVLVGSLLPVGWRVDPEDLKRYMDAKRNVSRVRGRSA